MRLSIDALQVLDAIERKGSFAAAAHELHRVPSAITYTVQKLEEDLDALLFDRRGHRAKLTAAGRELLTEGRHILAHRAVVVADSSRNLPPRSAGLLTGQETLVVHNVAAKLQAQQLGAGVGHLPFALAQSEAAAGRLIIKQTSEGRLHSPLYLAWRSRDKLREGKALAWWIKQVQEKGWLERAMAMPFS
jgi:DNA-binding transcriptional LysR family regulator